ncbi:MAG TPA: hypothetical protein VF163_02220, partial [Micromonosporaceae bacterium]
MLTVIAGGVVLTGDGRTVLPGGAVLVRDERIEAIVPRWPAGAAADVVVDATAAVVMPGLINCHTHGVTPGPLFPSGAAALPPQRWLGNLDRHLLAGTTTVLNLCGLATMAEVQAADRAHAVKVKGATSHVPAAIRAALAADGGGLTEVHTQATVESMLAEGAVAIGELGGGQTMGGGGQDLHSIPDAVHRATGVRISAEQARGLKEAALGRHLDPAGVGPTGAGSAGEDPDALRHGLLDAGLAGLLTGADAVSLIAGTVLPSLGPARDGLREGVAAAVRYGAPALVHSAAASAGTLREIAARYAGASAPVIATHCNHTSFTPDEAVSVAKEFAAAGWRLECSTFDLLHRRHTVSTREHWDGLFAEPDLITLLATDYGYQGEHDPLIAGIEDLVQQGHR